MTNSVLIVDDHPLYRDALTTIASALLPEHRVVSSASVEDGLRDCEGCAPRLVLLDFGLRGLSGPHAVAAVRKRHPDAIILVVSASEDRQQALAAMRAGALAFISKATGMQELQTIIQRALAGEILSPEWDLPAAGSGLSEQMLPDLPPRQRDIVALLLQGCSNKEIGLRLDLAEVTVKVHLSAVFKRLGVANRTQAVMVLQNLGYNAAPSPD